MTNPVRRPLLRYHGGKWNLAPWIISHFPAHRVYVEPFGGAASVLLRKPRAYAEIWNDLDQEVVNLFRVLRDPLMAEQLRAHLELTPFAREEFEQSYERATDPVEQARRMIARSYQGFGSAAATRETTGFRAASRRSGTIPAHDWDNYPKQLGFAIRRLKSVVIENRPAVDLIQIHDGDDTLLERDRLIAKIESARGSLDWAEQEIEDAQRQIDICEDDIEKAKLALQKYEEDLPDMRFEEGA